VAAARTTSLIPAAADEVSISIAQLFSQHGANYRAMAALFRPPLRSGRR
jgi:hypothetical protein